MTATLARTLTAVVDLCEHHRRRGSRTVDGHDLQATLATGLAAFAAAWPDTPCDRSTDPQETPADRSPKQ